MAASNPPKRTCCQRIRYFLLFPIFVIRLVIGFFRQKNRFLQWRQRLALTYLQVERTTFPEDLQTTTPTGVAIKDYCKKHKLPYRAVTITDIDTVSKAGSGVDVPPPTLHFVTPVPPTEIGPIILYFHGGAYVSPLRGNAHMPFVLRCAMACNAKEIVFLEYSLAPERQYPTQLVQAVLALWYLLTKLSLRAEDIIMAGDSAGGNLAGALLAHIVKPSPYAEPLDLRGGCFRALLFVSPWALLTVDQESFDKNAEMDYIDRPQVLAFLKSWMPKLRDVWADLCEGDGAVEVWDQVFPKQAGSLGLAKKAMVTAGTAEVLLDCCRIFAEVYMKAETVAAGRKTDFGVFARKDFVFAKCEGEVHVEPALDAAVCYWEGITMQAILKWLESV
ncbi:hypothetical protein ACJ72_08021 [Emergomyces africanus]|uniref:Alpha/beta hydrolase fold-3 domain-containing protein n=1 Tax=Emergomyces africanus TaxID=1955775 RepID=A0A1B7NLM5_9EURO|nr:hypothetical protein ACJ72_08021 [Emergomyces africanus]